MRINIKFLYLLPILIVFFTDKMFLETVLGAETPLALPYTRIVWVISLLGGLYFINYMSPFMKVWCILNFLTFFILILESLYEYGNPFQYPRVFSKVMLIFAIFFIYGFHKKFKNKIDLGHVVFAIGIFFFLNVILINRDAFSVSSFANHERGLLAESVYFLLIPCLYFFNGYFIKRKVKDLYLFCLFFALIIFLQHRTVWVCTAVALILNLLLLKKTTAKLNVESMIPVVIFLVLVSVFAGFFVFTNDVIMGKLSESIDDLMNPTSQGTGNFRWVQFTTYWPFIMDNFVFGMRLEGFELPVQFFDRDILVFEDGTGHHFHSLYVDRLFYFGIFGLLLVMLPPIYYITKLISKLKRMTIEQIVLVCYVATGITYGLSYQLQPNVYALIGLAIYYLETLNTEQEQDKIDEDKARLKNDSRFIMEEVNEPEPVLQYHQSNN